MKRSREKIEQDRKNLKEFILTNFAGIEFKVKNVYKKLYNFTRSQFNRSKLQMLFVDMVQLTKEGFLTYTLETRSDGKRLATYKIVE